MLSVGSRVIIKIQFIVQSRLEIDPKLPDHCFKLDVMAKMNASSQQVPDRRTHLQHATLKKSTPSAPK